MRKFKASILIAAMTLAALAQTAAELDSPEVNRVAMKLNCDCGCNLNMACKMPPDGRCPVCQRNKTRILSLQQAGKSDQQIIDQFVGESGKAILVVEPGIAGVLGPYAALGMGFIAVIFILRRYLKKKPALAGGPDVDPDTLARIEKETANFD